MQVSRNDRLIAPRGRLAKLLHPAHPATESLLKYGYAVVRVCSRERAAQLFDEVMKDLEALGTGIDPSNPSTWTNARWPQTTHGLLQNQGAGLWRGTCLARLETLKFWQELYGGQEVISSFDAISVCRVDSQERCYKTELANQAKLGEAQLLASWVHTDQAKAKSQCLHHIQGALALTPLGEAEQRTQLVVPKEDETMQSLRDRLLEAFPPKAPKKGATPERSEWDKATDEERKWLIANGRVVAPVLDAGQMILWDSGVPHASIPGPANGPRKPRVSTFVSALPISLIDAEDLALRKEMLERGFTSGHRVTTKGTNKPYLMCKFEQTAWPRGNVLPDFKMDRKVSGFKRAHEAGDTESVEGKMAKMCGGYGNESLVRKSGLLAKGFKRKRE